MRIASGAAVLALTLGLAACTTPPAAAPKPVRKAPAPRPVAAPRAAAPKPVSPMATDWRDIPETPGGWSYARDASGSAATFTETGGVADFVMRCDTATHRILLTRPGATGAITITTSYAPMTWPASPVTLTASDPSLDRIVFTRGRFTVESAGTTKLILPSWAEPGRVVEDCRG